ncbi:Protein kinase domain-containing protein, partial [Parelaphostrongylus tenuis]
MSRPTTVPPSSKYDDNDQDEIRMLVDRYCSPIVTMNTRSAVIHPTKGGAKESDTERKSNEKPTEPTPSKKSECGGRGNSNMTENIAEPAAKKSSTVHGSGAGRMPVAGGSSRSGRLARISQSNIRPFGSGGVGGGYGPGGQPLSGPDPACAAKKDVKHRFEITRKLGSGTYGKVSLAYDHKFDREVAVKLIKKSAIENKADLVRIRREIRIMSALHHPNIIQIFEVFENREKIILVMEYASGGELYDYVSQFGSLPESEARRIFRQITSAVLYCHK